LIEPAYGLCNRRPLATDFSRVGVSLQHPQDAGAIVSPGFNVIKEANKRDGQSYRAVLSTVGFGNDRAASYDGIYDSEGIAN
jgi:hypothetical protein